MLLDDNEIDNLPPIGTYVRPKYFNTPPEIQKELEKDKNKKESDFRRWLIQNKPKEAVMTPIETSTATGVPDIFCCYQGFSSWIECKTVLSSSPKFRGTQYIYLKKLIAAGGHAKVVVQRLSTNTYKPVSIWIYDAEQLVAIPSGMYKTHGQDMIFPKSAEPYYVWHYNKNKKYSIEDLYLRLLLDTTKFTW